MPIYEYHCGKCGDFEVMQKISDKPLATCPTCRRKVTKLISSTSFQLKGSGWYVTDYARKGSSGEGKKSDGKKGEASAAKSEDGASKSATGTAEKSSESKSDTNKKSGDAKSSTKAAAA